MYYAKYYGKGRGGNEIRSQGKKMKKGKEKGGKLHQKWEKALKMHLFGYKIKDLFVGEKN